MAETTKSGSAPSSSGFRVPHTLVLLFGMIVLALVLTYLLPQGQYERQEVDGHDRVVAGSYERAAEPTTLSPLTPLTAIPAGFAAAQNIIFFVFIVGGAFGVFRATGAADAAIGALLRRLGHRPFWLITGGILLFAVGSSTIGMAEEYIPFVLMLVALCVALGFDAVTAVGVMCIGYGIGYGLAIINPFTIFIAQDIAGLPQGSGMPYRLAWVVVFLAIGIHHVWSYASKVKADPSKSLVAGIEPPATVDANEHPSLTGRHKLSLFVTVAAVGLLIWGLVSQGWYLVEMGALFLGLSIVLGLAGRLGFDGTAKNFCHGAAELTTTALLIGFARTIELVLDEGQVVDTIIHSIASTLETLGPELAAVGMLVFQSLCNFFIPSGSGQAYVTVPLMAPIGDLVGVSRQVSVLAYQFGDGLTNILVPTNAVLVGILSIARIPYDRWVRFVLPFLVKAWIVACVALVVAVWIGWT